MKIEITGDEPRWAGVPVGTIVHACHEKTIDDGLAALALPGLDRDTLEPLLTYCAELRCEADQVTCPGCKRRTEAQGITSLDDFIARHDEIVVGDGAVVLKGTGHRPPDDAGARRPGEDLVGRKLLVLGAPRAAQAAPRHPPRAYPGQRGRSPRHDAGRDPGRAATARQYRHGGASHAPISASMTCGWSIRATAGRTRRRASPLRAPTTSSTMRRPTTHWMQQRATSTGCAPPPPASATCASP